MSPIKRVLREHQKAAMRYALSTSRIALFMDMRLGKTLVAVRRMKLAKPRNLELGLRVLIVAPHSALGSWENECMLEGISVAWLTGAKKARQHNLREAMNKTPASGPVFCLINKEGYMALPEIAKPDWDGVILDESTFAKNPKARVTKFFLKHFRDVPKRIILTGTPCPEKESNYYCQLKFLFDTPFGCPSYWSFMQEFMEPSPFGYGWDMKPGASSAIRRMVGKHCFVLQRKDAGLAEVKIRERREFAMPVKLRKAYEEAEDSFKITYDDIELRTKWIGAKWQWLRQMAGGFIDGKLVWNDKIDALKELAKGELARDQIVIWCMYNDEVMAISKALKGSKHMTGATKPETRRKIVREFQSGALRILVLQQAVGQMGMDLSASDTAIYYSTPPGFLARAQTEDRIVSVEKAARKTPLLYLDFVTVNTVDEDVQEILKDKKARTDISLSRALQAAMKARIGWTRNL